MDITKYKHIPLTTRGNINYIKIPLNRLGIDSKGISEFNEIYHWFLEQKDEEWTQIERTPSGGICKKKGQLVYPAYYIGVSTSSIEMIFLVAEGQYRFLWGRTTLKKFDEEGNDRREKSGRECYLMFLDECKKFGVDIHDYAIDNGAEVKKTIPSPKIRLASKSVANKVFEGAFHIDLNSSFMSGIALNNPELYPPINDIYSHRKDVDENGRPTQFSLDCKDILTHTYGFFQSEWCNLNGHKYALAHLSKQALEFNNNMIDELSEKLIEKDYFILAYNTDGIWVTGGEPYHGEGEGKELGQWKIDHHSCKIRFKSDGAYEFIDEDGKYHPVLRGQSTYDKIKPRTEWEWGDIYKTEVFQYRFIEGEGLVEI